MTEQLGVRGGAEQGSKEYFESIIDNPDGIGDNDDLIMDFIDAHSKGKLEYIKVQQGFNTVGDLLPTEIIKFDIAGLEIKF